MSSHVRVPSDIYKALHDIKLDLERKHRRAAPSLQNIANAAFEKFLEDWKDPEIQEQITADLLEQRKVTRQRQGPHAKYSEPQTSKRRSRKIINYLPQ